MGENVRPAAVPQAYGIGRRMAAYVSGAALLAAALGAAPALAGTFVVPKGCTAYVTVQHADCEVAQHYTCEGDAKGDRWSVYMGEDGPFYLSRIDRETRWMESFDLITGDADRLGEEVHPASFSDLLKTGRNDYDFTTVSRAGEVRRFRGYDRLTGEKVTIDGVALERTDFELTSYAADGALLNRRTGTQLVSRDWREFFADEEDFENADGEKQHTKSTPVTFAMPGEKGFLSDKPQFGCNQMMTDTTTTAPGLIPAAYRK